MYLDKWNILRVYCPCPWTSCSLASFSTTSTPSPPPVSFLLAWATDHNCPTWYWMDNKSNYLTSYCVYIIKLYIITLYTSDLFCWNVVLSILLMLYGTPQISHYVILSEVWGQNEKLIHLIQWVWHIKPFV